MSWPKHCAEMDQTADEHCSPEQKKAVVTGLVTTIDEGSNYLFYRFSPGFSQRNASLGRQESYYKATQSAHFHNKLTSLSSLQKFVKKSSGIFKSDSILVDGIIRVGVRLSNSEIEPDAKHLTQILDNTSQSFRLPLLSSCFDWRRKQAPLGQQKMASLPSNS
ncbi:hypothetical protein P5673_018833 [Acropora cervicornis]|uniref:Uncharacterized protein n=1 Tax=Acropora cervicornis TaxID=6130 RepID=A0AAD9QCF9_ACRCE|nr:hypothetical protein P5673_018833 [Acropora cervicornis]